MWDLTWNKNVFSYEGSNHLRIAISILLQLCLTLLFMYVSIAMEGAHLIFSVHDLIHAEALVVRIFTTQIHCNHKTVSFQFIFIHYR